jgi:hypothetical protein
MKPDANDSANDDQQDHGVEPFEDLGKAITVGDATQVKGGFDPQPDPPRVFDPGKISSKIIKY